MRRRTSCSCGSFPWLDSRREISPAPSTSRGRPQKLGVLPDVLHQDAARAALAAGDLNASVEHLRMAARCGPASRRAFHLWTLGSTLFLAHCYPEAIAALEHAVRWSPDAEPLYRAHLALARVAAGQHVADVARTFDALASAPGARGYGRFVLGHLAYASGALEPARRYLRAFVRRTEAGRAGLEIALDAELRMARATLSKISEVARLAARPGGIDYSNGVFGCGLADPETADTLFARRK